MPLSLFLSNRFQLLASNLQGLQRHFQELRAVILQQILEVLLRIVGEDIKAIAFRGEACAICMASASMMCEHHAEDSLAAFQVTHTWLEGSLAGEEQHPEQEALRPLLGVQAYPSRVKCVLLPWEAAQNAIRGEDTAD